LRLLDGSTRDYGTPPHGDLSAIDCSQRGGWVIALTAAGALVTWKTHDGWRAFVGTGRSWRNLGDLGVNTLAVALNDAGDALLDSDARIYLSNNGTLTLLDGIEGDSPVPLSINAADEVAASMFAPDGPRRPAHWSKGSTNELPRPPGHDAGAAIGINDSGAIVGCTRVSWDNSRGADHAALWRDGAVRDLNDLVATHELHLSCARTIGEDGVIVGSGYATTGLPHAFALLPQAPSTDGGTPEVVTGAVRVAGREEHAVALAVDAARVYWTRLTGSRNGRLPGWELRAAPKAGGDAQTLASGAGEIDDVILDDAFAYLAGGSNGGAVYGGQVLRVPLSGGDPVVLGTGSGQLAQDATFVYSFIPPPPEDKISHIVRLPKAGGASSNLVDTISGGVGLALDSGNLYWASARFFLSMPAAGGTPQKIAADGRICPGRLKLAGGFAYIDCGASVVRVPLAGGAIQELWAPGFAFNPRPDVDYSQGLVFWTESGGATRNGCLWRSSADGSQASCLESSPFTYSAVRVDDHDVWFIRDWAVYRLPR